MSIIEKRKIDKKGRVSLPIRGKDEIFFFKKGKTIILSDDKDSLENLINKFEDTTLTLELQSLKAWFNVLENLDENFPSHEEMEKKINNEIVRENNKYFEEKHNE
ncbi:MAG: hypothetical protein ACW98D_18840 [Promethearchaeota archaeon]|jgi:DNA-binding transcriptional regulator/RsmH inhibitor MraZ